MKRCGYVAIAGRPNVGKSTLMNVLIGQKLSITAHRPQTTRHVIRGISTTAEAQIIYVDTPGLHRQKSNALNKVLNRVASSALQDVNLVLFVVQAGSWTEEDEHALARIGAAQCPFILVVNKTDRLVKKRELLPYLAALPSHGRLLAVIPVAARTGDNIAALGTMLANALPEGDFIFSPGQLTDVSERFLAAEIVREQLTRQLTAELPYALTVEIEQFLVARERGRYRIHAIIWVERPGQKAIVLGRQGARIKAVGTLARKAMQHLFGCGVHLELWVKVKANWANDAGALRSLGYDQHRARSTR